MAGKGNVLSPDILTKVLAFLTMIVIILAFIIPIFFKRHILNFIKKITDWAKQKDIRRVDSDIDGMEFQRIVDPKE